MITVEVQLEATGIVGKDNHYATNSFKTEINGTREEVLEYYRPGKIFNMGLWYTAGGTEKEDDLMRVTSCEIISEN